MFILSRLADYLLLPSNLLGVLGLASVAALVLGFRRSGMVGSVLTIALLIVCGWSPLGPALLMALENRFPPAPVEGPVAGIIMLGGAVDTHISNDRGRVALNDAGERVTTVAELSREYPEARIVLSGGASHLITAEPTTESSLGRDLLVSGGVPANRIELEERSRNTCENAAESERIAQPSPGDQWLLVTSASHMPRAVACFRAVDFLVTPYPVDFRTRGTADLRQPVSSIASGLQDLDLAAHEWIGLLVYRMGRTNEFFPIMTSE
jgi:uncharacterized SAM-binding protein YcdF (DUF218 family)